MGLKITPVIMCGGSGSRLWPASRDSYPKQFLKLFNDLSTFQTTLGMVANKEIFNPPVIITNYHYRFLVNEQMAQIKCQGDIILEPMRRDSAAAVAAACVWEYQKNPSAVIAMLAADHIIQQQDDMKTALQDGASVAAQGHIVTLGMKPHFPATGYGYIQLGPLLNKHTYRIKSFVEKPSADLAESYIKEGYVWNSGNFIFSAQTMMNEIKTFEPLIMAAAKEAIAKNTIDLNFHILDADSFGQSPKKSIDYAVMEKTDKGAVIPTSAGWSDVGTWTSVRDHLPHDKSKNVIHGQGIAFESSDVFIHSPHQLTTAVGLDNIIIITTDDAVLAVHTDHAEKVKSLVDDMIARNIPQAREHRRSYRPWGYYQNVDNGERYQVKRIVVKPNGRLSLQKHHHRAEHWIVVKGTAEVVRDRETHIVHENESIYLPIGCVHRLTNPGKINLELIEVQTGSYFGEDDIIRIEDDYHRSSDEN